MKEIKENLERIRKEGGMGVDDEGIYFLFPCAILVVVLRNG